MGTRNKTIVKKNDKIIINQYGQWDGYPTSATKVIADFLRGNSVDDINTLDDLHYWIRNWIHNAGAMPVAACAGG